MLGLLIWSPGRKEIQSPPWIFYALKPATDYPHYQSFCGEISANRQMKDFVSLEEEKLQLFTKTKFAYYEKELHNIPL